VRTVIAGILISILLSVGAAGAAAADSGQAESLTAFYRVTWAGIAAANLALSFESDGHLYRDAFRVETVGVPRWLIHFDAVVHAEGTFGPDGTIEPSRYRTRYDLHHDRGKHQMLDFVVRQGVRVAEYGPGDSGHKNERLPEVYRRNVLDPLSALSRMRDILRRGPIRAGEQFTLPVFDDTSLMAARFTVESAGGGGKPVRLHLELRTLASYKMLHRPGAKDEDDQTREIELTLSGDRRLLPLSMTVDVALFPVVAHFERLCRDFVHCR
jgi:Protein of unknown function (DUF3108)